MSRPRLIAALLATLFVPSVARAETLSVPKDFPTIQAAVDAAGPGDVVEIASGKYAEDVVVSGKTGLTIRGKGKVTWNADGFAGTALAFNVCSDLRVEGLRFTASDRAISLFNCGGVLLEDLEIGGVFDRGLSIDTTSRLAVRDVTVDGAPTGLFVSRTSVASFDDLTMRDVGTAVDLSAECIALSVSNSRFVGGGPGTPGSGVIADDDLNDVQLRGNRIRDFGIGMKVEGSSVVVLENRVTRCGVGMILGFTGATSYIRTVGNRVTKSDGIGISVLGRRILLRDNRVSGAATGIFTHPNATEALYHGNRVTKTSGLGLALQSSANALSGNTVQGVVQDTGSGNLFQRDEPLPGGAILRVPQDFGTIQAALDAADDGDTVLISSGVYDEALGLSDADGITLLGKGKVVVTRPGGTALALQSCDDILVRDLRFVDAARGLRVEGSAGVSVVGCRFEDMSTAGFTATGSSALFVHGCRFDDADEAVDVSGSSRVVVERCRFDGGSPGNDNAALVAGGTSLSAVDNRLRDLEVGFDVSSDGAYLGRNRFVNSGDAIEIESEGGLVHANRIKGGTNGVQTDDSSGGDTQLVGNRVAGASQRGYLPGTSRSIIVDNRASKCGVHGMQHPSVTQILVAFNRTTGNGLDGLETQGAQSSLYLANRSAKNGGLDMRVTDFDGNSFLANKVGKTNLD